MENGKMDDGPPPATVDIPKSVMVEFSGYVGTPEHWQRTMLEKIAFIEHALTILAMTSAPIPKGIVDYMNKGVSFAVTLSAMKAGINVLERFGVEKAMEVSVGSKEAYWVAQGIIKNAKEHNGVLVDDGEPLRTRIYTFR